jgi:hypothetical protein
MEIVKIFARYTNAVSQIYLYQSAVKTNAKKELEQLVMYERSLEEIPELKGVPLSAHNMFFLSAENGKPYFFAYKESSIKDKKKAVVLHKNKQYQWLLAEVYELFEDFIKEADALAGYKDKNFWNLTDTRTEEKRKKLQPILNHFRSKLPRIIRTEKSNYFDVNLRLAIALVGQLRHIIVHKRGVVSNKEKFIADVFKKSGLSKEGEAASRNRKFIESFFGSGKYASTIHLLEIPTNPGMPFEVHIDIFEGLSRYLLAYAHLVKESLETHISNLGAEADDESDST